MLTTLRLSLGDFGPDFFLINNDNEKAVRYFERTLKHSPESVETLRALGHLYASSERRSLAMQTLTKATELAPNDVGAWLADSRDWSTPLHHLEALSAARTLALLRAGADLAASGSAGGPTPLSLARELDAVTGPTVHAAALVVRAGAPWGPKTHELWPAAARKRAVELVGLGYQLSQEARWGTEGQAVMDCWLVGVMKFAVERGDWVA